MTRPGQDIDGLDDDGLDPEIRGFIRSVTSAMATEPGGSGDPIEQMRRRAEAVRATWADGGPQMCSSVDRTIPTRHGAVRTRIHKPSPGTRPGIVYLHGGGWTMFSIDTHDRVMREYASESGCTVIGVDYALSPEARFPVALQQVIDVVCWLQHNGSSLDIDESHIAIGGDSAGANLSVTTCLSIRDSGICEMPRAMILNYGAFATDCSSEACRKYDGPAYMLNCTEMSGFWANYMRNDADANDPLVCPILAVLDDLPPVFLAIAECDILAEQNLIMARRFRDAGVPVNAITYTGASHSFLEAVSQSDVSKRALSDASAWIRKTIETD